jgi:type III pantothenate kinase
MSSKPNINSSNNLIIDVGNTLVKLAVFNNNELIHLSRTPKLDKGLIGDLLSKQDISRAIVSAVGEFPAYIAEFISQKLPLLFFSHTTQLPISNCYKTPSTLGADRLAVAVGANDLYPGSNVLSIDCGTAITYDLVTADGNYLGGAISPGIDMRFKALNQFTAKLPLVSFNTTFPLLGDTTETSILSGVLNGILGEVDGYIDSVKAQYSPIIVVFTGGSSFFFDKKLKNSIFVHPNLVLFGLNRILNYNENL